MCKLPTSKEYGRPTCIVKRTATTKSYLHMSVKCICFIPVVNSVIKQRTIPFSTIQIKDLHKITCGIFKRSGKKRQILVSAQCYGDKFF